MKDFDELYKTYYRQVFLYLLDLCGDVDLAEEITQETFFKVLKKIDTFEGKCSIGTWMIQIAKNNFYNYCKKKKTCEYGRVRGDSGKGQSGKTVAGSGYRKGNLPDIT